MLTNLAVTSLEALSLLAATATDVEAVSLTERFGLEGRLVLMQFISFVILAYVLYRFAIKPTLLQMDARNAKIEQGLRYTEEIKEKLADAERQHAARLKQASQEAQAVVNEARDTAKQYLERQTQDTAARTEQMLTKAQQAIELERRKMLAEARSEIARLVVLTTRQVLARELSEQEKSRYADAAARELTNA
jgi:F-type H+-transporting ATPase subunit b